MARLPLPAAAVVLLIASVLAGCIGGPGDDSGTVQAEADCPAGPLDAGTRTVPTEHDPIANLSRETQWDHELRNKRTCSLPAIGWHALSPDGVPHKYIGEIDMRGDLDLGAVAVLGNGEQPRVYLLDISNRSAPEVLSFIDQDNTYIVDVKISRDGSLLFTSSQKIPTSPEFEHLPALTGPTGFAVYEISDPSAPVFLTSYPDPQIGCHMMSHIIVDDVDWLFCVSQQVRAYRLTRAGGSVSVTGAFDYLPLEDGVPTPSEPPLVGGLLPPEAGPVRDVIRGTLTNGPHDMTLQEDPVDGRVYAIVSHWNSGVRVVDVTDLPVMTEVGAWRGEGATHYHGNVHTAMMFYVGEDRYIAATPEYTSSGAEQVPSLWILDANDLGSLRLVGEWFHPGGHIAGGLFLTLHQWQVAPTGTDVTNASDVRVYITYNHAGVWVLDLGAILAGDNARAILGFNLARKEVDPDTAVGNAVLNTWDVNVVDGHIYGSDRATGLWVFHYEGDALGDRRVTGFA